MNNGRGTGIYEGIPVDAVRRILRSPKPGATWLRRPQRTATDALFAPPQPGLDLYLVARAVKYSGEGDSISRAEKPQNALKPALRHVSSSRRARGLVFDCENVI